MEKLLQLSQKELVVIQDHLQTGRNLKQQIQQLTARLIREHRDLEIAFSNAVRRDMLDRGVNEPVPPFLGNDGVFNMRLTPDGVVTWADGREHRHKKNAMPPIEE